MLITIHDLAPYGFLFKPSTLWPPPSPEFDRHASDSIDMSSKSQRVERKNNRSFFRSSEKAKKKGEELASKVEATLGDDDPRKAEEGQKEEGRKTMTEPGSVLRVEVDGEEVEVRDQIQLYATNEQVCPTLPFLLVTDFNIHVVSKLAYPYVSPIWQPSLGGLCPLYILAGDSEVLRDEIIYVSFVRYLSTDPKADITRIRHERWLIVLRILRSIRFDKDYSTRILSEPNLPPPTVLLKFISKSTMTAVTISRSSASSLQRNIATERLPVLSSSSLRRHTHSHRVIRRTHLPVNLPTRIDSPAAPQHLRPPFLVPLLLLDPTHYLFLHHVATRKNDLLLFQPQPLLIAQIPNRNRFIAPDPLAPAFVEYSRSTQAISLLLPPYLVN